MPFELDSTLEGTSLRGRKKSAADSSSQAADGPDRPDGSADPSQSHPESPIRGPVCADSIAAYIQAIAASALERLFNTVVAVLAARSFFPKSVHATLDSSEIESTQRCEGCGMVTKEKPPELRLRKGRIKKVLERVFGFKIWV